MKLQIDTSSKTIKIENSVKFSDLIDTLKRLFPKDEWKEYSLEANTTIVNWGNPIYIDRYPYRPYWDTGIFYSSTAGSSNAGTITSGYTQTTPTSVLNIETN